MTPRPRPQRAQPRPARPPAAGDLRHHDPRRARRALRRGGAALSGSRSRSARPTTRARCSTGCNEAADDHTPVVLNAAAWTHYSYAILRRLRPADRTARRGAHQRPAPAARGVPAPLGRDAVRRRGHRRSRRRGLPDGPRADRPGLTGLTESGQRAEPGQRRRRVHERGEGGACRRPPVEAGGVGVRAVRRDGDGSHADVAAVEADGRVREVEPSDRSGGAGCPPSGRTWWRRSRTAGPSPS